MASFRRVRLVLAGQGMHWKEVTEGSLKKPTGQGTAKQKKSFPQRMKCCRAVHVYHRLPYKAE